MSAFASRALDANARLNRVANLLDQALADLMDFRQPAPGVRCSAALAEAAGELRALEQIKRDLSVVAPLTAGVSESLAGSPAERAALEGQLKGLLVQLRRVQHLLASAGDFYRGWCAAGYSATAELCYAADGYESLSAQNPRGPALLAVEG